MYTISDIIRKAVYDMAAKNWSKEVTEKDKPLPKKQQGLFTGMSADQVVKSLLKDAKNNPNKALDKLDFYVNRAGGSKRIPEKEMLILNRAKKSLEDKIKREKK